MKDIRGQVLIRYAALGKHEKFKKEGSKKVIIAGILEISPDVELKPERLYTVTGYLKEGNYIFKIDPNSEKPLHDSKGKRLDQIMVDTKWKIPILGKSENLSLDEIEAQYF